MATGLTSAELLALFGNIGSVNNSDCILLHQAADNTTKKITAELLRAYLNEGFAISVNEQGYLVIGGQVTDTKLVGMSIRTGLSGLEISTDGGDNWTELISYTRMMENAVVYCTEQQYEAWVLAEEIDEDKIYYVYEE